MEGRAAALRAAFDDSFAAAPIAADAAAERLLIISVAGERLLIRLADIAGLFADRRLVAVPRTKPALLGIIGLRGAIVPVFALSVALGYPPPQRRPRWLVTAAARPLAFAFDGFEGHVEIPARGDRAARRRRRHARSRRGRRRDMAARRSAPDCRNCVEGIAPVPNHWTLGRKLGSGFAVAALILLIVAFVGYRATAILIENDERVEHSRQVQVVLADLLSALKDAETGQRGFLITGDNAYLAPYRAALNVIEPRLALFAHLTADNPDQQRRAEQRRR